ncbi:hypothetical protein [Streptomyces sp. NPDC002054]|uniref:hypothetical protein n=1 Tax=Streptomyces sp. NPDC002054 TaxID=3154663 RepID=UPI0033172DFE
MRAVRAAGGVLVWAAVLGGCTFEGPAGPAGSASSPAASPAETVLPPTRADERLVTVTRSGGLAGRQSSVRVQGDGSWTRLDGAAREIGSGRLAADRLARLRTALAEAGFPRLPRIAMGDGPVFDGFVYAFVHGGYEVATTDGSVPPGLSRVLDELPAF